MIFASHGLRTGMTDTPLGNPSQLFLALAHLGETIDARAEEADASKSYTAKLLAKGTGKIGDKIIEEASEVVDALKDEPDANVASEASDLLYHLFVGLRARGISLDEVGVALFSRQGMSGLEEKAGRS